MVEHLGRYDDFAKFMNTRNVLVIGNDHLGHGLTAKDDNDLGYFGKGLSKTVVDDLHEVTKYAKETYGRDIPFFLFGHSMGSFMARRYIMTYGSELTGVIISGTGSQPGMVLAGGKLENHRRLQKWNDKTYNKAHGISKWKTAFGGASS